MKFVLQARFKVKGLWEKWGPVFSDQEPLCFLEGAAIPPQFHSNDEEEYRLLPLELIGETT